MFTDDTNLLLNKEDWLDYVQRTLDKWCKVSGARFNIEKTEIIPIGTKSHRKTVADNRKINAQDNNPSPRRLELPVMGKR